MQAKLKLCKACKVQKAYEEFHKHKTTKDRHNIYCKECVYLKVNTWNKENPEKHFLMVKNNHYKTNYKISYNDYLELYDKQEGCCKICNKHKELLHVDHEEGTFKVRSLLCGTCNRGIGMFYENPIYLYNAAKYCGEINAGQA